MRKIHLLCIAPYEGLYHLMTNLAAQRDDVKLTVRMGNLDDALSSAPGRQDGHVDAIISRGGTSELLRKSVDIPVYDVTPSVYDILRTIRLAQEMGESFAVVGFPSIARHARTICENTRSGDQEILTFDSMQSAASRDAAAGGYADGDSFDELREKGFALHEVLQANDAYHALRAVDGLIVTGPTGTNVNDLYLGLIDAE